MYIAHLRETGEEQSVKEHLEGAAELCEEFAKPFGFEKLAFWCGISHDVGKYSDRFQAYIKGKNDHVDHSTAGAQMISQRFPCGSLLAYCVAGHHSGLPNGGSQADMEEESSLWARMKRTVEPYQSYRDEFDFDQYPVPQKIPIVPVDNAGFSVSFAVRMLFSCLVDADFLDTEKFMSMGKIQRSNFASIAKLSELLDRKLLQFENPASEINQKRTQILQQCIQKAEQDRNLFTLTVPTGGGKTFASLAFALKHARRNKMDRIIYVIPYTSIIEQNAAEFKKVLGDVNVLEHHSNFDFSQLNDEEVGLRQKLASENWDVPVVVTTNVQFFESLFASRVSRCRKLHNIANSVIIFDEAQMLPVDYLRPCVYAIAELVKNYRCTAVLCSATQPALQKVFPKGMASAEIVDGTNQLYEFFKRTEIVKRGGLTNEMLAEEINALNAVLCIVNTKKHAKDLFKLLKGEGDFHLSALMCPRHRSKVISQIKQRLVKGLPCRVVSTQIIEAGVDVDFPVLYRSMAGLDEIIQAAGRCNREGKGSSLGLVHLFTPEEDYTRRMPASLKRPISVTEEIMRNYDDIMSPQAIKAFFSELYQYEGGLDAKGIMDMLKRCEKTGSIPFRDIEQEFQLIENNTKTVIIPYDAKAEELIQQLQFAESPKGALRALQPYTVSVYEYQYAALLKSSVIKPIFEETAVLADAAQYSPDTGLNTVLQTGEAIFL